jgi:hypothetical protein
MRCTQPRTDSLNHQSQGCARTVRHEFELFHSRTRLRQAVKQPRVNAVYFREQIGLMTSRCARSHCFVSSAKVCQAVLLALVIGSMLAGCAGMKGFGNRAPIDSMAGVPKPRWADDPQVDEVVDHLNRNTDKLQAWRANSVKIRAKVEGVYVPLKGTLAVERDRRLRLVVDSLMGNEVDIGSNEDRFWIWAKRMPPPQYVFCRHEQMDEVRQTTGIPFEPDWLMQALGVSPITAEGTRLEVEPTARQARLVQQITSAHGKPLRKVIVVDLPRGVIVEHSVYDYNGQRVAVARLEDHQFDKATGVVLPRRVKLDCPQSDLSLVMQLGTIDINPRGIPTQIWEMPNLPGYQVVDLGAMARPGTRYAANAPAESTAPRNIRQSSGIAPQGRPAPESAVEFLPPDFGDDTDESDDTTGRVKLDGDASETDESPFADPVSFEEASDETPFGHSVPASEEPRRPAPSSGKQPIPRDWWNDE